MKKLGLLGATGSIGTQTLDVVRASDDMKLELISVHRSLEKLDELVQEFSPAYIVVTDPQAFATAKLRFPKVYGPKDLAPLLRDVELEVLLNAVVGTSGLLPTYIWLERGKKLALANKESLVSAGEMLTALKHKTGAEILPVDSEHSAIWQCLAGRQPEEIDRLILTASGGAFRDLSREEIAGKTAKEALNHPNWTMGQKITIDSATLLNKGLEVMEARWLFDIPEDKIDVLVHRESIVHSMVEFRDGAVMAQLGLPDMKLPIQYALNECKRKRNPWPRLDFSKQSVLHFERLDEQRFDGIRLARKALAAGGAMPLLLNVANEVLVKAYLKDQIGFYGITEGILEAMDQFQNVSSPSIDDLLNIEKEQRTKLEEKWIF